MYTIICVDSLFMAYNDTDYWAYLYTMVYNSSAFPSV